MWGGGLAKFLSSENFQLHVYGILHYVSEVYEAKRWHDDPLYQAPMIVTDDGSQLFVGDIVEVLDDDMSHVRSHAKVIKFMTKVKKKKNPCRVL